MIYFDSVKLLIVTLFIFQLPESPLWLLTNNRPDDAHSSLLWLRGFPDEHEIAYEFEQMQIVRENCESCADCRQWNLNCLHTKPSMFEKLISIASTQIVKAFLLIGLLLFIAEAPKMHVSDGRDSVVLELTVSCLFVIIIPVIGLRMSLIWAYVGLSVRSLGMVNG